MNTEQNDHASALNSAIDEYTKQINKISDERAKAKQDLAELLCPYEVGQFLRHKDGDRAKLIAIRPSRWKSQNFDLVIKKVKNNGDLYQKDQVIFNNDSWSAE